jgi:hypothetical protein
MGKPPSGYRNLSSSCTNWFFQFIISYKTETINEDILEANSRSASQDISFLLYSQIVDCRAQEDGSKLTVKYVVFEVLTAVIMKSTNAVQSVELQPTFRKKHVASIFRVEE